jgi:TolB-like protein
LAAGRPTAFAVGDWLVEPDLNRISTATESIYLRKQLMDMLVYLAEQQGRVTTLEALHDDLWRGKVVTSGTIYSCIADLRQALARDGRQIDYIETIPKTGYRLASPVVTRPTPANRDGASPGASVAILPLTNRSEDPQIEYLCEGIVDEVLHRLKQIRGLRVFSAFTLREEKLDPRVVGLRFGARTVLSGSLRKSGDRLRLTFRLDDVYSGESIWADRYDHQISDVLEIQDLVATQIAQALSPALGTDTPKQIGTRKTESTSFAALNAFLLGKHALSGMTAESFDDAIRYFQQAIAIDPTFARAHYRLYLACHMSRRYHGGGQARLEMARVAAANARRYGFRPPVPWIHIERRLYREGLPDARSLALEAIEKIRDNDPEWGSFGYEQLTWVLPAFGFFVATRDFAKHMFDSPWHNFEDSDADEELPNYFAAIGEFGEAIRLWSSEIQKDPGCPLFRYERSVLYSRTGQFHYAERDIETLEDDQFSHVAKAFYHFWHKQPERVREYHDKLRSLKNVHGSFLVYTHCMLDEMDQSLEHYVRAVSFRPISFIDFGPLRVMCRAKLPGSLIERMEQHPIFADLLAKQGITAGRQAELMERLNEIATITGITVAPDEPLPAGRLP